MNQASARSKIELLKEEVRGTLNNDALKLKRAIIREIDALWREYKNKTEFTSIERFAEFVFNFLQIPKANKAEILYDLRETQKQINEVWNSFYKDVAPGSYKPIDYEKLIATYSVDFKQINKDVRDVVVKTFRESVNKNYGFETIRTELLKNSIGTAHAYTLANTSVSMFDNAAMFEYSLQAGINKFKYDGILQPTSRIFCVEHFQKIYTYQQILKLDNKMGTPVLTTCGSWNCHHFWTAVINSSLRGV